MYGATQDKGLQAFTPVLHLVWLLPVAVLLAAALSGAGMGYIYHLAHGGGRAGTAAAVHPEGLSGAEGDGEEERGGAGQDGKQGSVREAAQVGSPWPEPTN